MEDRDLKAAGSAVGGAAIGYGTVAATGMTAAGMVGGGAGIGAGRRRGGSRDRARGLRHLVVVLERRLEAAAGGAATRRPPFLANRRKASRIRPGQVAFREASPWIWQSCRRPTALCHARRRVGSPSLSARARRNPGRRESPP